MRGLVRNRFLRAGCYTRRGFAAAGVALLATPRIAWSDASNPPDVEGEVSDEEVVAILREEGEPTFTPRAIIENFWFHEPEEQRTWPHWPSDELSYDYRHLAGAPAIGTAFSMSANVLEQLLQANSFSLSADALIAVFGLRGCVLPDGNEFTALARQHEVRTARPDHLNLRCLLGVWDRQGGTVALFVGSTVPNVDLMHGYVVGALGCNMMPMGLHRYRVGPHRGSRQPGAFRQSDPLWVLRSPNNLGYAANDRTDIWDDLDGDLPFDNIHAAMLNGRSKPPFFSSAGCQVVAGRYNNGVPTGAWAEFRRTAGLAHPPVITSSRGNTEDDGREYDYVLLTGDEAALSAQGTDTATLRFGSSGPNVAEFQRALGFDRERVDGRFGRDTLGRYLLW